MWRAMPLAHVEGNHVMLLGFCWWPSDSQACVAVGLGAAGVAMHAEDLDADHGAAAAAAVSPCN